MIIKELSELRRHVCEWAAYAMAREVLDAVYRFFVEQRDKGPVYSSCADLAHCVLFRVGCREPWVNRDEHLGFHGKSTVWKLVSSPITRDYRPGDKLEPGDILIIWNKPDTSDSHVCVVERVEGAMLHTFDLGQDPTSRDAWASNVHWICSERKMRKLSATGIKKWISMTDVLPLLTADVDLLSGERMDAIEGL